MEVYTNASTSVASFGSTARIGGTSTNNIRVDNNGIHFYKQSTKIGTINIANSNFEMSLASGNAGFNIDDGETNASFFMRNGSITSGIELSKYGSQTNINMYGDSVKIWTTLSATGNISAAKIYSNGYRLYTLHAVHDKTTGLVTIPANSSKGGSLSVSLGGETAVGVIGWDMSNYTGEGGGANVHYCSLGRAEVSSNTVYYEVYNHGAAEAKIQVEFIILYRYE
jgi:hypothetical protein